MKKTQLKQILKVATGNQPLKKGATIAYKNLNKFATKSTALTDEYNPAFILNDVPDALLQLIADGEINMQELAAFVLNR